MQAHEYLTQTTNTITVMLDESRDGLQKKFHCPNCGNVVMKYFGGIKLMLPGEVDVETAWLQIIGKPFRVQCKNKRKVKLEDGREVLPLCKTVFDFIV